MQLLVRWERLRVAVFRELRNGHNGSSPMTPKFKGIADRMAKLRFNLDADAEKLAEKIDHVDAKRVTVFDKSHKTVDGAHQELEGIDQFIDELDRTNDPPRSSELMKE
jgi:hypothetical protein